MINEHKETHSYSQQLYAHTTVQRFHHKIQG